MQNKFLWGVATSATQIEGATLADGRKDSIWDVFSRVSGNIKNGDVPTVACNSYRLWKEDIRLLKELGVNSYRYSISWSRVLPDGRGVVNHKGLDYYKRLTDELLNEGIQPNITLYHWDLPYELHKLGGWLNRDVADWFADYAEIIYKGIPHAGMYVTHNEPIATYVGYAHTGFAPGLNREEYGRIANHNLLLSHGKAVQRFRELGLQGKIGIVVDVWNRVPLDAKDERDVHLAKEQNDLAHGSYLSPIFLGEYNDNVLALLKEQDIHVDIREGDLACISAPLDFYGLNCYNRVVVSATKNATEILKQNGGNFLQNGNEYYPDAIYDAVKILRKDYRVTIPVYVTENGIGFEDEILQNGTVNDIERIRYLQGSLQSIEKANAEGLDVRGYYVWSLMDNFEWNAGYSMKFGIHTRDRKPKQSALFYKNWIENHK